MTSYTDHAGSLQLLGTRLRETDTTQRVVPAHSTHVVHALRLLSLLGSLSAVNESTPASPHAILVQSPGKSPLDGVKAHVPDDGPDPGSNDIVAAANRMHSHQPTFQHWTACQQTQDANPMQEMMGPQGTTPRLNKE